MAAGAGRAGDRGVGLGAGGSAIGTLVVGKFIDSVQRRYGIRGEMAQVVYLAAPNSRQSWKSLVFLRD